MEKYVDRSFDKMNLTINAPSLNRVETVITTDPLDIRYIPNNYEELIHDQEVKNVLSQVRAINVFFIDILGKSKSKIDSVKLSVHDEIIRLKK